MNSSLRRPKPPRGFALMLVLVVILTSSVLMLGMYQSLHLQTRESMAREQIVVNRALIDAGTERATAMLLKDPSYQGDEKFETPPGSGLVSVLSVYPSPKDKELIELKLTLHAAGQETSVVRTLSLKEIDRRRKELNLK